MQMYFIFLKYRNLAIQNCINYIRKGGRPRSAYVPDEVDAAVVGDGKKRSDVCL